MTQNGIVTGAQEGMAQVSFARSEACGRCRACSMGRQESITITISNEIGASPGDMVEVLLHGDKVVKASAIVYIFPLAAFLLGLWIAPFLYTEGLPVSQDLFSSVLALALLAASFIVIRLTEKKRLRVGEFSPQLIRIITDIKENE